MSRPKDLRIGARLRDARQRQGLTIDQIAQSAWVGSVPVMIAAGSE